MVGPLLAQSRKLSKDNYIVDEQAAYARQLDRAPPRRPARFFRPILILKNGLGEKASDSLYKTMRLERDFAQVCCGSTIGLGRHTFPPEHRIA